MGVLDSTGYKYTCQSGSLKVLKGGLVVMKARKIGNFYRMEGKIKMSKTTVVSEEGSTCSYLSHNQMNHMNEK